MAQQHRRDDQFGDLRERNAPKNEERGNRRADDFITTQGYGTNVNVTDPAATYGYGGAYGVGGYGAPASGGTGYGGAYGTGGAGGGGPGAPASGGTGYGTAGTVGSGGGRAGDAGGGGQWGNEMSGRNRPGMDKDRD